MGGLGSGRSAWRNEGTVESRPALDVRVLHRGPVRSPAVYRWSSSSGWKGSVGLTFHADCIELNYTFNGAARHERVGLEREPCHFGGARPWFRCPVGRCQRRVAVLHLSDGGFVCRQCARLAYASQRAGLCERGWSKIEKANKALGLHSGDGDRRDLLPKPKRMHWKTFSRLVRLRDQGRSMRDAWIIGAGAALFR